MQPHKMQDSSLKSFAKSVPLFILRPTSVRIWHKAVFKVGPIAGPKPNAAGSSKMPRTPSAFPFSGRLRRRAINLTPQKRVKAWGDGPLRPEVMYLVVEHTRTNSAASNHSRSRAPHHRTQSKRSAKSVPIFVAASHQTRLDTRSKARRPIKVGIKRRGGRERIETRTLLVSAAHRLT